MTLQKNFPGRKSERRAGALARAKSQLKHLGELLERKTLPLDIYNLQKEIQVKEQEIANIEAKKFVTQLRTKKTGINVGRNL